MSRYDHITLLAIPSVSTLTVLLFSLSFSQIPDTLLYTPFIISALFLGLPNGAVDHTIPNKINSSYKSSQIVMLYLTLMILYLILWYLEPLLSAIIFIIITWIHWGQGDLYVYDSVLKSNHTVGNLQKVLHIIIRGSLPMFVPLCFHRSQYVEVIKSMSEMVSGNVDIVVNQSVVSFMTFLLICLATFYVIIALYRLFESDWRGIYILR
jgi:Brp/Blh family beta-carotene 15,15'-monooxygenase